MVSDKHAIQDAPLHHPASGSDLTLLFMSDLNYHGGPGWCDHLGRLYEKDRMVLNATD